MKLTIEASCHNLKQVTTFEGSVEEYQEAFGEDTNPAKVRDSITNVLAKRNKQLMDKILRRLNYED